MIFLSTCQYLVKQWEVPQRYFCVIKSNQKVLLNERLALTQEKRERRIYLECGGVSRAWNRVSTMLRNQ